MPAQHVARPHRQRVLGDHAQRAQRHPGGVEQLGVAVGTDLQHLAGRPVIRVDIVRDLRSEQMTLVPVAAVIYLFVLALLFRRLSASLILLGVVGMGLSWGLAILVVSDQSLNLVSNVLPILLLILGVSNGVHILSRYAEESALSGENRNVAAVRTFRHIGGACLLAVLTTAIGFSSLWAARADVLNSFATQALIGLACLCASILVALGTFLPIVRPPVFGGDDGTNENSASRSTGGESDCGNTQSVFMKLRRVPRRVFRATTTSVVRHPKTMLIFSLFAISVSLWMSRDIRVNSSTLEMYDESHPTVETMHVVDTKLGGLLPISVVLKSETPGHFLKPETVRRVAEFQEFVKSQPEVLFARSYVDLHRAVDHRLTGGDNGDWPPPGAAGRDRIERSEWFLQRRADETEYRSFITRDASQVHLRLRVRDVGTRQVLDLTDRIRRKADSLFGAESGVAVTVSGGGYVNARSMDTMIRDLFWSLAIASLAIFGIMALLFRSVRLGLISMIPNVTPLILTLGYMGIRGLDMNAANVIVFTISLGIAVDDTIHFLYRFREEQRRTAGNLVMTVQATLRGTGRPI
ncbi:MAG: MMPL family transporter, partial [Proteobacteria bacterium]|nr:MMPL family transporter [Pseudomonadota bacterium]